MSAPHGAGPAKRADAQGQPHFDRFATAISALSTIKLTERQSDNPSDFRFPGCSADALCIAAFDPGQTGAYSFYFPAYDVLTVADMPIVDGEVDAATLAARIAQMRPDFAVVERVASRPGQGVASTFKFGCGYGMLRGVIAASGVPLHLVTPTAWKKHFRLSSDKEASRALALRLWPARSNLFGLKKHHGRAEAALIARYAYETGLTGRGL